MRAFIDRIESGIATVLLGEEESVTVQVPITWLPKSSREGTILRVGCEIDTIAMKQARENIRRLRDSLPNEP